MNGENILWSKLIWLFSPNFKMKTLIGFIIGFAFAFVVFLDNGLIGEKSYRDYNDWLIDKNNELVLTSKAYEKTVLHLLKVIMQMRMKCDDKELADYIMELEDYYE